MASPVANQSEGQMDLWVNLPSMTQRMYIKSPDMGKLVMKMSANDPHSNGSYTTEMARYDSRNLGEIFWRNAKKHKTVTFPAHLLENNRTPLGVYNYQSEYVHKKYILVLTDKLFDFCSNAIEFHRNAYL